MPFERGNLVIWRDHVTWLDEPVVLTRFQRMIFTAIVRSKGAAMPWLALAELTDIKGRDPVGTVYVHLAYIRRAFRRIDPTFQCLETVAGVGVRWTDPLPIRV